MALISFVDSNRQWFKAKVGVPASETPRDISICGHAIAGRDFFEVKDLHKDNRFFDNPLVCGELNLRYYGGVPIISEEGFVLGVLCVMNNRPFALNHKQVIMMKGLASQVRVNLNLKKSLDLIRLQQKNLTWLGKLAILGEVSASLSHELNNILFLFNTKISLFRKKISMVPLPPLAILLNDMDKLCAISNRLSSIVHGVKAFSRKDEEVVKELVSVEQLLEDTLLFCRERIKMQRVELILDTPSDGLDFRCSATHISQVLVNLLQNSLDAIEMQEEKWIKLSICRKGPMVEFSVEDSGPGIDKEIQEKVLQPFFTTKEKGRGTGLGLSVSKSILDAHNGSLSYDPTSAHTRFVFSFLLNPDQKE